MNPETHAVGLVASEFGSVQVSIDHDGNGPRLRIEDLKTGQVGFLDALELETLAWLPEGGLHKLLDPSLHRWRDSLPPTHPQPPSTEEMTS
ncbi:MAG TPA: hypothetical protein VG223_05685 [Solirubrobacteraceae bacterium]|jgi:hypothetical protein|nr:hypothetical protein [Solirubrobacteraceae bacterium]